MDVRQLKLECILCNSVCNEIHALIDHMQQEHWLYVDEMGCIADLPSYLKYWKSRLTLDNYKEIVTTKNERGLHILDERNLEDKSIRKNLKKEALLAALAQQEKERNQNDQAIQCLFCRTVVSGNRKEILNHMNEEHAFNLGLPDNLVYIDEFLNELRKDLESLVCLYCKRTFRDLPTLKDHMRKKRHKKINADNRKYDKFYIINYLDPGKGWKNIQEEEDIDEGDNHDSDEEWSDPKADEAEITSCLFCKFVDKINDVTKHMCDYHNFDIAKLRTRCGLSIYEQIKIINYLRLQKNQHVCGYCSHRCNDLETLSKHIDKIHLSSDNASEIEILIPEKKLWTEALYLFPTVEDDPLLCILEEEHEGVEVSV